ncbi:MAG TPA: DNA polymerase III subunit delta [Acidimicrobiales bacterium]|nr:DNA polymerase III subunit delta [Acidimicrobiales bacterium]
MSTAGAVFPAYLVRGDDPTVTADAVRALVGEVVGDADPALVVEELSGEELTLGAVVDAAQTPPFFADRRVVVARDVGRFTTQEAAPLVAYLADPLPTTTLVLVGGGGQLPRSLVDAVRKVGHVVDAGVPTGRARSAWLAERLREGPVRLDAQATALVGAHLGDEVGRLSSLLETLAAAYGHGARLTAEEVTPFLGQAGPVAPWELTDAIDAGDTAAALDHLHRLLGAGGRHPLVLMATLHTHYARMLRLDGAGIADEKEAAAALGMTGSTFPAKKALAQARRLGHDAVARAITLLADADLALKGTIDWPPELVMEVLVARLSRLAPRSAAARSAGARRR